MCSHSSIVTEANHNGFVFLFRGSFETQQIFEDRFFSKFDGLSKKYLCIIKNQNAIANWASMKDSVKLKSAVFQTLYELLKQNQWNPEQLKILLI